MDAFVHVLPDSQFQSWLTKQEKLQKGGGGPPVPQTTVPSSSGTTATASGT
jgi:heme/copper-type cytochrome/quinol oxidase subunit 2